MNTREWTRFNYNNERILRDHPGLASFYGDIVVLGGTAATENHEALDAIESFNMETNAWSIWPTKLNRARAGPAVIQVDQLLYVIGGRGQDVQGSVEVFDQVSWTVRPDLTVNHPDQEYAVTLLKFI